MTRRNFRPLALLILLAASSLTQAGVYKCETTDGRIAYSDKPCMDGKSSELRVSTRSGSSHSSHGPSMTSTGAGEGLDCPTSVSNGQDWIESMREVGQRNLDTGHMSREQFNNGMKQIDDMAGNITVGNCQGSTGHTRKFFECLGDLSNHLARCGQRHNPVF